MSRLLEVSKLDVEKATTSPSYMLTILTVQTNHEHSTVTPSAQLLQVRAEASCRILHLFSDCKLKHPHCFPRN